MYVCACVPCVCRACESGAGVCLLFTFSCCQIVAVLLLLSELGLVGLLLLMHVCVPCVSVACVRADGAVQVQSRCP